MASIAGRRSEIVEYIPWIKNLVWPILGRMLSAELSQLQKTLSRNLRAARKAHGLSQEALALNADVDRTYISQIERSISNPSLLVLVKIAAVLQIQVADLLTSIPTHQPRAEKAKRTTS